MGWLSVLATEVFVIINYAELCASMVSVIVQELQVFLLLAWHTSFLSPQCGSVHEGQFGNHLSGACAHTGISITF